MGGILDGKAAVVTGGGTGIGAAIARRFAAEGARVVVAGRRPDPIARVAAEIGGLAVAADIAREDQVRDLMAACDRAYGRLDVLVNNASVPGARVAVEATDVVAWDEVMAINVRGLILCIKHAVPIMKRHGGSIINVSSRRVSRNRSDYIAAKFARNGITEAVAHELGPLGIRVNTLWPGGVATEMFKDSLAVWARNEGLTEDAYKAKRILARTALGRMFEPDEMARAALFLAGDAAGAVTGTILAANGGRM